MEWRLGTGHSQHEHARAARSQVPFVTVSIPAHVNIHSCERH